MAGNKTTKTRKSAAKYVREIADETKRVDCEKLLAMMADVTGEPPAMWGDSIVGFGSYHYKYASGREGDFFLTGFAPRKQALTVYVMPGFDESHELFPRLGKFKTGRSCLYMKRLADVDEDVLRELVEQSVARMRELYPDA